MYYWFYHSTHNEFAAKAFHSNGPNYLLKLIDGHAVNEEPVKKGEQQLPETDHINPHNQVRNINPASAQQKIALPYREGYEFVEVQHIIYCQAEGAYTKIFLDNRKYILVSKTLGDIEVLLPIDIFYRIHHSTVVNLGFITHFVKSDGGYLKLQTGVQLAVSKPRKEGLMQRLGLK